jgi:hypothetical protein
MVAAYIRECDVRSDEYGTCIFTNSATELMNMVKKVTHYAFGVRKSPLDFRKTSECA